MNDPITTCPRCGIKRMTKYPALSRLDNESHICSECGTAEAMDDFMRKPQLTHAEWFINTETEKPES